MIDLGLIILELGSILVFGFLGAYLFKKIHIPQVLGFILSGFIIGLPNRYYKEFLSYDFIEKISHPLVTIALGIIGFNIGAELSWKELKKIDKRILAVLFADSIGTFLVVALLVGFLTPLGWNFAFILGALGSATAPAATADILWEYKSSGPLTQAVLFILAIDDIVAIILVQITTSVTLGSVPGNDFSALQTFTDFAYEVGVALAIGIAAGIIVTWIINRVKDHGEMLEFIIGILVVIIGFALFLEISAILGTMVFGAVLASFGKRSTTGVFHDIFKIGGSIIAIFFIMVGFSMDPASLLSIGVIGTVYLVGRTIGKVGFVNVAARAVKCKPAISKYLGFCLFSQAGVALGLAVEIDYAFQDINWIPPGQTLSLAAQANLVLTTITGTIIIVQVIGPLLVRWAIHKAGEVAGKEVQIDVALATGRDELAEKLITEEKEQPYESVVDEPTAEETTDKFIGFSRVGKVFRQMKHSMKKKNNSKKE